ncbi:hypothetical protein [Acidovorax sp. CCYZU-2555]|uniref:hypothetical protein n=1 Tax=Acidovorax sp. CCYZU-2555 TaxID=2835042 RepID=UPI001BCA7BBF|nr:hypothetical protein [Acidovorax sp. CCYZU-2555]MBS7778518.1 hypothetical protein [Acidovorax sp. CCYZU-2555]
MLKILLLDDYQGRAREWAVWSVLPDTQVDVLEHALPDLAARAARFAGYQVIVAMRERTLFSQELIAALPDLQLLVTTGMRNAAIDMAACAQRGITVCGAPGSQTSAGATAELAWALMLALAKRLPRSRQALLEGHWQPEVTQSLAGRTLGLAGLGWAGLDKLGQAMGMQPNPQGNSGGRWGWAPFEAPPLTPLRSPVLSPIYPRPCCPISAS